MDMQEKNNYRTSKVVPRWTNGDSFNRKKQRNSDPLDPSSGRIKNGSSAPCRGWNSEGIQRFNEVETAIRRDRKQKDIFAKFEAAFKKWKGDLNELLTGERRSTQPKPKISEEPFVDARCGFDSDDESEGSNQDDAGNEEMHEEVDDDDSEAQEAALAISKMRSSKHAPEVLESTDDEDQEGEEEEQASDSEDDLK